MVSGRNLHSHALFVLHHDPVTTDIHPPGVRIPGHHHTAGADIVSAIMLMPLGRRKLQEINVIGETLVLKDRPARDLTRGEIRRRVLVLGHFSFQASHQLLARIDVAVSQSQAQTRRVKNSSGEYSPAWRETLNVFEQQRRSPTAAIQLRYDADFEIGIRSLHSFEFPQSFHFLEPGTQIMHGCFLADKVGE